MAEAERITVRLRPPEVAALDELVVQFEHDREQHGQLYRPWRWTRGEVLREGLRTLAAERISPEDARSLTV